MTFDFCQCHVGYRCSNKQFISKSGWVRTQKNTGSTPQHSLTHSLQQTSQQQVRVQHPPSAVNVTLPALVPAARNARCTAPSCPQCSAANPLHAAAGRSVGQTDRQTDGRTLDGQTTSVIKSIQHLPPPRPRMAGICSPPKRSGQRISTKNRRGSPVNAPSSGEGVSEPSTQYMVPWAHLR